MRPGTRRRLRAFVTLTLSGTLAGAMYGTLAGLVSTGTPRLGAFIGIIHGAAIAGTISAMEIFLTRSRLGYRLEQAPFLVTVLVKALMYGAVIVAVQMGDLGLRVLGVPARRPSAIPLAALSIVFGIAATFVTIFVLQMSQLVGTRTLRNIVLGRYHRPRHEERFFLFVDIVGSTALAERVGAHAVHRFLNTVFGLASDVIDDHDGEVYQYVGDEIVVTWTVREGRRAARPLRCFLAIAAALAAAEARLEGEFGIATRVRGALHAGPVISGEVGKTKREIVFHGDVMNTTARLEQLTRDLDRSFLVSAEALPLPEERAGYVVEDLGERTVRGRAAPVLVYAVTPVATPAVTTA
jgi:adenylate cyclase